MTLLNLAGRQKLLHIDANNLTAGGLCGVPKPYPGLAPLQFGMARQLSPGLPTWTTYQAPNGQWWSGEADASAMPACGNTLIGNAVDWNSDGAVDFIISELPPGTVLPANLAGRGYMGAGIHTYPYGLLYGYIEGTFRFPTGQGPWGALWLLPTSGAINIELDVFESFNPNGTATAGPTSLLCTAHSGSAAWLAAQGVPAGANGKSLTVPTVDLSQGYHRIGADWQPQTITWYVDGVSVGSLPTPPDMNSPMFIIVNHAAGVPGSWTGGITAATPLPARLKMLSLDVWQ